MSYWTFPEESVWGGLTRVLSPDDAMGEAAWTGKVRQANNRTNEKPNTRQGMHSACCCFNCKPPAGRSAFIPQTLTAG
jgi:hypothetical protein